MRDLEFARDEVSASSAGGAPFLIAFGGTILVCAVAAFFLPVKQAACAPAVPLTAPTSIRDKTLLCARLTNSPIHVGWAVKTVRSR